MFIIHQISLLNLVTLCYGNEKQQMLSQMLPLEGQFLMWFMYVCCDSDDKWISLSNTSADHFKGNEEMVKFHALMCVILGAHNWPSSFVMNTISYCF